MSEIPKVNIPEGQSGNYRIERFEITPEAARFENMRAAFQPGGARRSVKAGTFSRLMRGSTVVMSDTPAEMDDHWAAVRHAQKHVLLNGLGIGMVLNACLLKQEVEHATVVEISEDVIQLAGPFYQNLFGNRLTIIHASAFDYQPPKGLRYGMVWHDIWDHICADNLPEMHRLHRKYGRRTDWQGSWCRELCEFYSR